MDTKIPIVLKTVILGDCGVGKTAILDRYMLHIFYTNRPLTIGCDFYTKMLVHRDSEYKVQMWDTAGSERFRVISKIFYRNATLIVL